MFLINIENLLNEWLIDNFSAGENFFKIVWNSYSNIKETKILEIIQA